MTTETAANPLQAFTWTPQPEAEKLVLELIESFLARSNFAADLARRMKNETGTRFHDWVETICVTDLPQIREKLAAAGYEAGEGEFENVYSQPHGMFPRISLRKQKTTAVQLKVEHVADFAAAWNLQSPIEGDPFSPYRRVLVSNENDVELWATERWGYTSYEVPASDPARSVLAAKGLEAFRTRKREFDDDADGYAYTSKLVDSIPLDLDFKCALFFAAEREYWQRRNHAARVQWARQNKLGLGWGNHDHHTYRCSRENFAHHTVFLEKLGFHCRERFYAGREAGWGAQVMEHPVAGIITFNDVDLTPDELMGDFSHDGLVARDRLGTVGLWCGLHGDSFLQAGMHHLEAQFSFDELTKQLEAEEGVKTMKPFTNFTYLRQAFTEGERWSVRPRRIARLLEMKLITSEQAKQFAEQGAIGSHLENLERNEGFKGFNQTGVSEIISATDPRKQLQVGV